MTPLLRFFVSSPPLSQVHIRPNRRLRLVVLYSHYYLFVHRQFGCFPHRWKNGNPHQISWWFSETDWRRVRCPQTFVNSRVFQGNVLLFRRTSLFLFPISLSVSLSVFLCCFSPGLEGPLIIPVKENAFHPFPHHIHWTSAVQCDRCVDAWPLWSQVYRAVRVSSLLWMSNEGPSRWCLGDTSVFVNLFNFNARERGRQWIDRKPCCVSWINKCPLIVDVRVCRRKRNNVTAVGY